jgi:hypothetical protein
MAPLGPVSFALVIGGCSSSAERRAIEGEIESRTIGTFNDVPSPVPSGQPGALIRSERLLGAPDAAELGELLNDDIAA